MASSLLPFLADSDLQNTQKHNKQVCFSPDMFSDISPFRSVNLLVGLLFFPSQVADLAVTGHGRCC